MALHCVRGRAALAALVLTAFFGCAAAALADDDAAAPETPAATAPGAPADAATDAAPAAAAAGGPALLVALPVALAPGDVALSGFSGARLTMPTLPAGVDPLDKTAIDPDAPALRILDLSTLGGPTVGQVVNAPVKLAVAARDIGQVFALAFDDGAGANGTGVPNLYAAATSLFGLQIVGDPAADGSITRLRQGDPRARFMDGQFGSLPGAGPGAIWKIDGTTGAVTHLADTAFSGVANSGPGIGDLAFDPASRTLYASDLDTGLIHRFALDYNAADLGQFDHGMSGRPGAALPSLADDGRRADILSPDFHADDPATWGFTQPERRVEALAVHNGRLYYSVADGPTIWSVGLGPDGAFDTTARLELAVDAEQPFNVTDIVFDDQGRMILAQRAPQQSPFDFGQFTAAGATQTLRFTPAGPDEATANLWTPEPEEFAIGLAEGSRQGAGGVTLGKAYNPDGTLGDACDATLMTTGDDLRDNPALAGQLPEGAINLHGVQINDATLVLPQNLPPTATAFAAFDPADLDPAARGHIGDVEAVPCTMPGAAPLAGEAAPAETPSLAGAAEPGLSAPLDTPFGPPVFPNDVPPVLEPLPAGGPGAGLTLSKFPLVEACTADGGDCSFVITVHNPGPDPFPGPFSIDDVFTTAEGAPLPNARLTSPPDPEWQCSAAAPISCIHQGALPVGDTSLKLSFAPGDIGGETGVVNCVLPTDADTPVGDGQPPANPAPAPQPAPAVPAPPPLPVVSDQDGLKVEVIPKVPNCSAVNGGCDFDVVLTADGPNPVSGPLTFILKSSLGADPAQAAMEGAVVSEPEGFACQPKQDDEGSRIECTNNAVNVQPGKPQTLTVSLKAKVPPGSNAGSITARVDLTIGQRAATASNSIAFNDAPVNAQPAAGNAGIEGAANGLPPGEHLEDRLPPQQCAFIAVGQQPGAGGGVNPNQPGAGGGANPQPGAGGGANPQAPQPNAPVTANGLTFSKTLADGVTSCTDNGDCKFTIHVKNNSAGPVSDTTITEVVQGDDTFFGTTGISVSPTPPWTCNKQGQTFQCTHPGPIAAGASADFTIGFKLLSGLPVKEIENCIIVSPDADHKPCVTVPVVKPAPPVGIEKLQLKKLATANKCSDIGGGCEFVISVTNPGPAEFDGPLSIIDRVTVDNKSTPASTEGTPQAVVQPGVTAPVFCNVRADHFECAGNIKLPAGKTIDIPIGIKIGTATGGKEIENCVAIDGVADKPCASIPLVQGPLLRAQKFTASHTCTPNCIFSITIQNIGSGPASLPISFEDTITAQTKGTTISVIDGDFGCATVAAQPARMVCITENNAKPLLPGQSVSGRITISGLPDSPAQYVNCIVGITAPGNVPIATDGHSCATVQNDAPKQPNIVVQKLAPEPDAPGGMGHCNLNSRCGFHVLITNNGTAPFSGTMHILDEIQNNPGIVAHLGQGTADTPIKWNCPDGQQVKSIDCTLEIPAATPLLPNSGAINLDIDVTAGAGVWKKDDILTNCATFIFPPGQHNLVLGTDKACASVKLDPFDVKVNKTADQPACAPGATCGFTIDLFDPGPIPHDAPVTISDHLDAGTADIISIDPPLPCAQQPTRIPFTCTSPGNFPLKIGQHVTFHMTVKMPATAAVQQFTNCAAVAPVSHYYTPPGGVPHDASTGCATVSAQPPAGAGATPPRFRTRIGKSGDATCTPGAACHFTLTLLNDTSTAEGPMALSDRLDVGTAPIVSIDPPLPCTQQPVQIPFTCATPSDFKPGIGQHLQYRMTVLLPAALAAPQLTNCATVAPFDPLSYLGLFPGVDPGSTSCFTVNITPPPGTGGSNGTVPPVTPPPGNPARTTPPACFGNMVPDGNGNCACPAGTSWDGRQCSPGSGGWNGVQPPCPAGTAGIYPDCEPSRIPSTSISPTKPAPVLRCPRGTTGTYPDCKANPGSGHAYPIQPQKPAPVIKCPAGTGGIYPNCRPIPITGPGTGGASPIQPQTGKPTLRCPQGTHGIYPRCVPDRRGTVPPKATPACPAGTHGTYPDCRPDRGTGGTSGVQQGPARQCGNGMVGTYPRCACPAGTRLSRQTRTCAAVQPQQPRQCPAGTHGRYPRCIPDAGKGGTNGTRPSAQCPPPGHLSRSGQCIQPEAKPQPQTTPTTPSRMGPRACRPGTHYSSVLRRCVPGGSTTTTPSPAPAPAPQPSVDDLTDFGGKAGDDDLHVH